MTENPAQLFSRLLEEHESVVSTLRDGPAADAVARGGELLLGALQAGGTLFVCGNGGSAADAQHFAAELTGRFERKDRPPLPAVALTVDSSALTSMGNDFGFEHVFARQLQALAREGDVLVGISTSGRSPNVLAAMERAKALGVRTIALTGEDASGAAPHGDVLVPVPSPVTARIQEAHILIIHAWCALIDSAFAASGREG